MPAVCFDPETVMQPSTALIHAVDRQSEFAAFMPAVHKASTVFFDSMAALRRRDWRDPHQYGYGLSGTPTTTALCDRLALLEGVPHVLLAPSGLAAISLVNLALLHAGDEVLLPDNVYAPNLQLVQGLLQQQGIHWRLYDALAPDAVRFAANTRLIWLEAAGSVTLEFPDLLGLNQRAQAAGVLTALDHTWGAGLAYAPFALGEIHGQPQAVDLSVHALTNYPSGGADVLMGSVATAQPTLFEALRRAHHLLGLGVAANDVELVLRGLPSMALRYQAQDQTTRALAQWLVQQQGHFAGLVQVLHPALPDSPGHGHWQALTQGRGAASLVSLLFAESVTQAQVDAFCDALQRFRIGYSWGGPVSLVMAYDLQGQRPLSGHRLPGRHLVRLVIGLEALEDLQADLWQAAGALREE